MLFSAPMPAMRTLTLALLAAAAVPFAVTACEPAESGDDFAAGSAGKGGATNQAGATGSGAAAGKGGSGGSAWGSGGTMSTVAGSANLAGAGSSGASGSGGALPSSGCGAKSWPTEREYTLSVGGVTRAFSIAVPTDYEPSQPYPVIFSWHGLAGSMGSFYQLNGASRAGATAIHLSPQGLDNAEGDGAGWWNTDGQDLAFVDALMAWTEGNFCVDATRLFSVGFSVGGMFSHLLGCERGDKFRAIAPIAGSFYSYYGVDDAPTCANPVPMLGIHGTADDRVRIEDGEAARDVWVARNGCSTATVATEPEGCVLYQDCMTGYPVEWCTHAGTHMVPSFAADVIWHFFAAF